ncbi:unnamed protein product [Rhizophagus irregularis]|nr:unnamed protein product [Rhizophagus irregularis]CAB4417018.1 unnamed protein product [Rhizophagus irregularis]
MGSTARVRVGGGSVVINLTVADELQIQILCLLHIGHLCVHPRLRVSGRDTSDYKVEGILSYMFDLGVRDLDIYGYKYVFGLL